MIIRSIWQTVVHTPSEPGSPQRKMKVSSNEVEVHYVAEPFEYDKQADLLINRLLTVCGTASCRTHDSIEVTPTSLGEAQRYLDYMQGKLRALREATLLVPDLWPVAEPENIKAIEKDERDFKNFQ